MKRLTFELNPNESRLGAEHSTHYFARMKTPQEVADATLRKPPEVQRNTSGHWVLSGPYHMFQLPSRVWVHGIDAPGRDLPTPILALTYRPCSKKILVLNFQYWQGNAHAGQRRRLGIHSASKPIAAEHICAGASNVA